MTKIDMDNFLSLFISISQKRKTFDFGKQMNCFSVCYLILDFVYVCRISSEHMRSFRIFLLKL